MPRTPLALFRELASAARPAGGEREAVARRRCQDALERRGFRTTERPFEYSAWPGLYGTPVAGGVLVLVGGWMYCCMRGGARDLIESTDPINLPLTVGSIVLTLVIVAGIWVERRGTVALPWLRRRGVNLEAVYVGEPPTVSPPSNSTSDRTAPALWLVAHLDSKSQFVPMLLRVAGVVLCTVAWLGMLSFWAVTLVTPLPGTLFAAGALLSAIGALPLAFCFVGQRGTGALDNASGVATILAALDRVDLPAPIGVLITSAEELGLAGAQAWAHGRPPAVVVNCDSIDDDGRLVCMLPRAAVRHFAGALEVAGRGGVAPRIRRVIPGVLVDAVAFTVMEWPALTVSRGRWRSLSRIHTKRDDLVRMTGAGIDEAADFVARLAGAIIAQGADHSGVMLSSRT